MYMLHIALYVGMTMTLMSVLILNRFNLSIITIEMLKITPIQTHTIRDGEIIQILDRKIKAILKDRLIY